jgi:site-specific recombinase XerD
VAADEEGEEPEQVEEEGDHEPRLWPDGADRSITCRADNLLARDSGPMHRRTAERMVAEWGRAVGVVNCLPHRFRHTFGTELLRQKQDLRVIKDAMGHEDIRSTIIYTEVTGEAVAAAVATLPWKRR